MDGGHWLVSRPGHFDTGVRTATPHCHMCWKRCDFFFWLRLQTSVLLRFTTSVEVINKATVDSVQNLTWFIVAPGADPQCYTSPNTIVVHILPLDTVSEICNMFRSTQSYRPQGRDAQGPGARPSGRRHVMWWRLILVDAQYETYCVWRFWILEFWGGSKFFRKFVNSCVGRCLQFRKLYCQGLHNFIL
jgi:hypothetical protein